MSKPKKNLEKARQFKGLGNSGLKKIFLKLILDIIDNIMYNNKVANKCCYGSGGRAHPW